MRLSAFTILESMMALVVIMISFIAGMTLYLTVLQGDAFPLRTKARSVLDTVWKQTKEEQRFLEEELEEGGFFIQKEVKLYEGYQEQFSQDNVYQISLKAFDPQQQLVATKEQLIRVVYDH
ncbi:MAG: hypothetical protein ACRBFS_22345 [Aureispira sp.]